MHCDLITAGAEMIAAHVLQRSACQPPLCWAPAAQRGLTEMLRKATLCVLSDWGEAGMMGQRAL